MSGPGFTQTSGSQRERQGFAKEQRYAERVALASGSENGSPTALTGHPSQCLHTWASQASAAFQDRLVSSLMMSERHSRKEWKAGEDQGNIPEGNQGHRVSKYSSPEYPTFLTIPSLEQFFLELLGGEEVRVCIDTSCGNQRHIQR